MNFIMSLGNPYINMNQDGAFACFKFRFILLEPSPIRTYTAWITFEHCVNSVSLLLSTEKKLFEIMGASFPLHFSL